MLVPCDRPLLEQLSPLSPSLAPFPLQFYLSMYSRLGQPLSPTMSTVQLSVSEKDSNPLQIDSPSNSRFEFTQTNQIPSLEVEVKDNNKREGKMEAKGEESSPCTLLPPSSSSSCSSEEVGVLKDEKEERKNDPSGRNSGQVGVEEEKEADQGKDVRDDGDGGYHTPTSPRNRIPAARVCPPAPKKPVHLLCMRRKVRAGQVRRRVDDMEGEIGSFWGTELDDAGPRTKKARGEATNDQ